MGENESELINRLSRQLERARELADLYIKFLDYEKTDLPPEVKEIFKDKITRYSNDKEE